MNVLRSQQRFVSERPTEKMHRRRGNAVRGRERTKLLRTHERQWQVKQRQWKVKKRQWHVKKRQWQVKERQWQVKKRRCVLTAS